MALASLSIDLVAKLGQLETDLGKAVRLNEKAAADMEKKWAAAGSAISSAMGALGGAAAVTGLAAMFRSINDGIDKLNDIADATGATVESISQLEDVALRTGTSIDVVETALVKMNQALAGAKSGSDADKVLKAIGLSAEELRKQDPAQALQQIAVALNQYENDGNKARIVQELFGKSLKEVAPLLKDMAENGLRNATVTAKQAEEAEKLNKVFFELQKNSTDVARSIAGPLAEGFNKAVESIKAATSAFGGFWAAFKGLATESAGGGNNLTALQGFQAELAGIQTKIKEIKALQAVSGSAQANILGEDLRSLEERGAKVQKLIAYYSSLSKLTDGSAGGGRGSVSQLGEQKNSAPDVTSLLSKEAKGPKSPTAKVTPEIPKEFLDSAGQAREAIARMIDDSAVVKAAKLSEQMKQLQVLADAGLDPRIVREIQTALGGLETVEISEDVKRLRDELNGLFDASVAGQTARYSALLAEARSQFDSGAISAERYVAIVGQINKGMASLQAKQKETAENITAFWDQAQRNIQDALGSGLVDILDGNFKSIGESFSRMLKQMAAQAIAADLANSLFGSMGKDGKRSGDGWVEQGISWLSSTFGGGRASGGTVGSGKFYEVNEQGPELLTIGQRTLLMMGKQAGQVTPIKGGASGASSGAMSVSVNVNNTVGEIVTPSQLMQVAEQTRRAVMAGVADARMRGRMA
jgi:hypothetical protein